MEKAVGQYLYNISAYYGDDMSSEMSYRAAFQNYLETIFSRDEKYHIQHDPKAVSGNKPDFIVLKNSVPLLYIEVKKIGEDLDRIEKSAQAERYFGYTNLVISDYVSFRFFRNGERYGQEIALGKIKKEIKIIESIEGQGESLARAMREFISSNKEPIKSGKHLAKIMGGKARRIRDNVLALLESDNPSKENLLKILNVIKQQLISELTQEGFADMYAQTLVYGLFAARYNDTTLENFDRREARDLVPATNPFLRHFFDHIAGADFPQRLEIIVDELCEVFAHADVKTLMEEYFMMNDLWGKAHEAPDPVIHFYEDFLREYDSRRKMEMGVFYTPLPVVRFIVRTIDEILKSEFTLTKGLADKNKIEKFVHEEQLDGSTKKVKRSFHKVQLLDFATGTGTFLNETIAHIHTSQGNQVGSWSQYVRDDLIPRLFGFELMMASYTIAHLKLAMTLQKSGVESIDERLGIYLTDSLEDAGHYANQGTLFGFIDSIAEESKSASRVKKQTPVMVVMGNPPYSGESMNPHYTDNNVYKVEPGGRERLQERNSKWINDDYVKFMRLAESMIEKNEEGVMGVITAHGYVDNPTFRGMRWHLRKTFDKIYVLDLHGNSNKKETNPQGGRDENVFDIKTGVSIFFGVKTGQKKPNQLGEVYKADLYGSRKEKFAALDDNSLASMRWTKLPTDTDKWIEEGTGKAEYEKGFAINELFPVNSVGIVTARDEMSIQYEKKDIEKVLDDFRVLDTETLRLKYNLRKDVRDWSVKWAKEDVVRESGMVAQIAYRPFDTRWTYYTGKSKGFHCMPREEVMRNFLANENIGLELCRQTISSSWEHVFLTSMIVDDSYVSNRSRERGYVFPLYIYEVGGVKHINLNDIFLRSLEKIVGDISPEDVFDYIYAYLHSPNYREKYKEFLKSDFPRVQYPENKEQFKRLIALGKELRELHLLKSPVVNAFITSYSIPGSHLIEKVSYKDGRVYINESQYFGEVPENAWNFYIGGYQPVQKWLKDRKGRILSSDDIDHYQRIVVAVSETRRLMKEIDAALA